MRTSARSLTIHHRPSPRMLALASLLVLGAVVLVSGRAQAAKWLEVDLADLAGLPTEALDALKDPQHVVQVAETELRGAEVAVDAARDEVKLSNQTLKGRKADLKAAKLERKAAQTNDDDERTAAANTLYEGSKAALAETVARLKWAKKEQSAARARVDREQASLERARGELERARVQLLVDQGSTAAANYAAAAFQTQVDKAQVAYTKAANKADKLARSADAAKKDWEGKMMVAID